MSKDSAKRLIEKRKKKGLCITCGGTRDEKTLNCSLCKDRHKKRNSMGKLLEKRKAEGVCMKCGEARDTESTICSKCRKKQTEYMRRFRLKNGLKYQCVYEWIYIYKKRKEGTCTRHGCENNTELNPKTGKYQYMCRDCRRMHNAYMSLWRAKRLEQGLCQKCGKQNDTNKSQCSECEQKMKDWFKNRKKKA